MKREFILNCRGIKLTLSKRTHIMGILNVTPDSFYDGGRHNDAEQAVARAREMIEEGADIIDVGGESTRPGAAEVSVQEEIDRTLPVIERLVSETRVPVSIDTRKAAVAEAALQAGAHLVNDVSGLSFDPGTADVTAKYQVPVVLMHMRGLPENMQQDTGYDDLMKEVLSVLQERVHFARDHGIKKENIILDPGIGFGKSWEDNYLILNRLEDVGQLGFPLLIGVSRKSFIGKLLGVSEEDRLMGTAAAVTASILKGVHIIRVHDVKAMKFVAEVTDKIHRASLMDDDKAASHSS